MSGLKVGDEFPAVKFKYIPYTEENSDIVACGIPQELDAHTVLPPFRTFNCRSIVLWDGGCVVNDD